MFEFLPLGLQFKDALPGIVLAVSFFLGSIPFGVLVARIFKVKDLTKQGSGNIGTSNVSRVVGFWPAGVITLALDVGKGAVGVLLALPVGTHFISIIAGVGSEDPSFALSIFTVWAAGFSAVLGHCFSPWLHFKGGKGVATGLGAVAVLFPPSALAGFLGFGLTFFHTRIASLSSIVGLILASVTYLVLNPIGMHLWLGAALIFLILIKHEANIDALLENREKAFTSGI